MLINFCFIVCGLFHFFEYTCSHLCGGEVLTHAFGLGLMLKVVSFDLTTKQMDPVDLKDQQK